MVTTSAEAVIKSTGKSWDEWFALLDEADAAKMTHKEIANWLHAHGDIESGWWCQSVAVAYEQRIGRRKAGQTCDGDYSVGASRTLNDTIDDALGRWSRVVAGAIEFNGVALLAEPTISSTGKWRYWRAKLADGSRVNVNISAAAGGRAVLNLDHDKLTDDQAAGGWKTFWRKLLAGL
jgi:hypothetical protein